MNYRHIGRPRGRLWKHGLFSFRKNYTDLYGTNLERGLFMQIKTEKGRDFYECESCKKVYSFKVGRKTDYWMRSYCKECAKKRRSQS